MTLPNPLHTGGSYVLDGGSYQGDVGSNDLTTPVILYLQNNATGKVTMDGEPWPTDGTPVVPANHVARFSIFGSDTLEISGVGGGRAQPTEAGDGKIFLNPGAQLSGSLDYYGYSGPFSISGPIGSALKDFKITDHGGAPLAIDVDMKGSGVVTVLKDTRGPGGSVGIGGAVDAGEKIDVPPGPGANRGVRAPRCVFAGVGPACVVPQNEKSRPSK